MKYKKIFVAALLAFALAISSCVYIVLPEGIEQGGFGGGSENRGWAGMAIAVDQTAGGVLRIEVAIRNDTGDWSTMRAVQDSPALLQASDGNTVECDDLVINTGGHRLAPGFQMRGFTMGPGDEPQVQPLYIECPGIPDTSGATLSIDYISFIGELDYYVEVEETNKVEGVLEISLDEVNPDLSYPVAETIEGLIQEPYQEILALSENIISLLDILRDESGFTFTWQNFNPSKFPLKTHIGIPPVIGDDGIIYGVYVTLDIPEVPLTPAGESVEWTTTAPVPTDIGNLYILLSVESKKPRTYLNYALDITAE